MSVLEVQHVTGGYTRKPVIKDLSFTIGKGELVGLIGLNGAGKSTTIKHIIGTMLPKEGDIRLNGVTLKEDTDKYRTAFSYIPETPVLYDELTLREHLELTAMAYGINRATLDARSEVLLKEFRMEKRLNWFPSHFSKGMRQKVMIMCAFLVNPSLYIIDEPFVGLDPLGIQSLLDQMDEKKKEGASILMSTHILSTAEKHCDRIILLHEGRVRAQGTMAELRQSFAMPNATLDDLYIAMTKERDHEEFA
ncbi:MULTISPECIES: ABC transporter ATP-binding protein [Lysinibacillus]|jgi:ABC-2 type transport system ATP-binding protein|uniref:ABC transporter ATP-binding protein n=1 Tax=Lysinibacillus fusiformis TaxID=28031 RepID=A0A2I0V307_9BACI|nr:MULTISPECIES: ABC transporter ATP-binding protein [Lysinibacillus]KUF37024.1 multidrug ABC transporter ATP-binding protein [Lysinibacillus sp. F5]MEE3808346.1 ABC transporter ATP-binding protein [Lysinibacillus fusiformis]PKU52679.1 ABC transporter ATP-binding protein [Lysinibacillus fusiformis]WCH47119.1 ABC transporter ATP-binding protein [Lysinibacillus sp. OF-1]SCY89012.1 ABC-2 type transport system ATP-binding protein [Lysinibacillus sp. SG9]